MTELPLFYRSITPLDSAAHRRLRIGLAARPFGFAAGAHLLPALIEEFAAAARHIPVVFAPAGKTCTPVFLCGLEPGRNLFVDADGRWDAPYVPAYLRRYPFILGERGEADPLVCIDTAFEGLGETTGTALFEEDGSQSRALAGIVRLVADFAASARRTEALCERLTALDLLKTVTIDVQKAGATASIHGLSIVDEDKLAALPDEDFLALRRGGLLPAVFAHLFSIGATNELAAKLRRDDTGTASKPDATEKGGAAS